MKLTKNHLITALLLAGAVAVAVPAGVAARGMDESGMQGHGGPMLDFDLFDADKDGKVTEQEVADFRANMIAGADANGDGKLSVEELTAQHVKMLTAMAAGRSARMIAERDADGDGLLSVEEMAASPMPAGMFDRIDTDGDGGVTKAEFDAARTRVMERMGGRGHGRGHGQYGDSGRDDAPAN